MMNLWIELGILVIERSLFLASATRLEGEFFEVRHDLFEGRFFVSKYYIWLLKCSQIAFVFRGLPSDDEDLGLEAKKEIEIEDELEGGEQDPNAANREILARAIKEEKLRLVNASSVLIKFETAWNISDLIISYICQKVFNQVNLAKR